MVVRKRKVIVTKGKGVVKSKAKAGVKTSRKRTTSKSSYSSMSEAQAKKYRKKSGTATLESTHKVPITKRTYDLETKRKGSKKGYHKINGRYSKDRTNIN